MQFALLFALALAVSAVGFRKYVYFFSIGYGFSIAVLAVALMIMFHGALAPLTVIMCLLLAAYGCRLGGYIAYREASNANYRKVLKSASVDSSEVSLAVKCAIWIACALLYVCQVSPVWFRLANGAPAGVAGIIGCILMACGFALEAVADWQKSQAKKVKPHEFVSTGVYRIVRCPNYLGEVILWLGSFVSGLGCYQGLQWLVALAGLLGIWYVMLSGARRLEIRQKKAYGMEAAFQAYTERTALLLPGIHFTLVDQSWLVG